MGNSTIDLYAVVVRLSRRKQVVDVVTLNCRGPCDSNAVFDVVDIVIEKGALAKNAKIALVAGANSVNFAVLDHRAGGPVRYPNNGEIRSR